MTRHVLEKDRPIKLPFVLFVAGIASLFVLMLIFYFHRDSRFFAVDSTPQKLTISPEINLSGAYFGYSQFRVNGNTSKSISAPSAAWIVSNHGNRQNPYPFLIDDSVPGVNLYGGIIFGTVPQDLDWLDIYNNSAAVMVRDAPRAQIYDWTITEAWDGIRIAGSSDWFRIENVEISAVRDDAVENDFGANGTIANSLLDGVFSGISMTHKALPDLSLNTVTLDRVLMRMQSFPFKGDTTHQSPFKIATNSPSLKIYNSVIAIEDVNHIGVERLRLAWAKTIEASDNYFLNLSEQSFPANYPVPQEGWTVLHGQAARDHWAAVREKWISSNRPLGSSQVR